ncbi:unnamed protein product [Polarella glacialis]|uniref:Uncharacterized protein n=1 Tax=Polarella glacialis TaxID=89957 RepID=A0A813KJQ6_POLGL|nr:unnamed protein product [Polarella glacialis]CAE8702804.1 unnamed protein product [Polarella glacialis]
MIENGQRVECKSSQLNYSPVNARWDLKFHGVKLPYPGVRIQAAFDELILVMYSPNTLHIVRHDLQLGVSTAGVRTGPTGHHVILSGSRNMALQQAITSILGRFESRSNNCRLMATISTSDDIVTGAIRDSRVRTAMMDGLYEGIPLSSLPAAKRGLILQAVAFELDQLRNPFSSFITGREFHKECKFDWIRNAIRVECKSAMVSWNAGRRSWGCFFAGIKFAHLAADTASQFDELQLAVYSPLGIHLFRHDGNFGVSSAGVRSSTIGGSIVLRGPVGMSDMVASVNAMLQKLETSGCKRLSTILW